MTITEGWAHAAYVLFARIGLYLTYVGWAPPRQSPTQKPASEERGERPATMAYAAASTAPDDERVPNWEENQ